MDRSWSYCIGWHRGVVDKKNKEVADKEKEEKVADSCRKYAMTATIGQPLSFVAFFVTLAVVNRNRMHVLVIIPIVFLVIRFRGKVAGQPSVDILRRIVARVSGLLGA